MNTNIYHTVHRFFSYTHLNVSPTIIIIRLQLRRELNKRKNRLTNVRWFISTARERKKKKKHKSWIKMKNKLHTCNLKRGREYRKEKKKFFFFSSSRQKYMCRRITLTHCAPQFLSFDLAMRTRKKKQCKRWGKIAVIIWLRAFSELVRQYIFKD